MISRVIPIFICHQQTRDHYHITQFLFSRLPFSFILHSTRTVYLCPRRLIIFAHVIIRCGGLQLFEPQQNMSVIWVVYRLIVWGLRSAGSLLLFEMRWKSKSLLVELLATRMLIRAPLKKKKNYVTHANWFIHLRGVFVACRKRGIADAKTRDEDAAAALRLSRNIN